MADDRFRKAFLLLLLAGITLLFVLMVRPFLLALFLAAIFSGLLRPVQLRLERAVRGRRRLGVLLTLALFVGVIVVPLLGFLGLLASEAYQVSTHVGPWVQRQLEQPERWSQALERLPGYDRLLPYRDTLLTRIGQLVGSAGQWFFDAVSATTRSTVSFFFQFFLMIYAMWAFMLDGPALLRRILYYMPLPHRDEERMLERFTSVTRATLRGSLLIAVVQGALGGIALAVAGVQGAAFWGTVMVVLSVIPGIGPPIVWVPAAIYLALADHLGRAVFVALFCGLVVGSIDNVLRPRLVGRDIKMHDLLVLFSTLGGIALFGFIGFIVGPIIAALFVTVWDLYGVAFRSLLPEVGPLGGEPRRR